MMLLETAPEPQAPREGVSAGSWSRVWVQLGACCVRAGAWLARGPRRGRTCRSCALIGPRWLAYVTRSADEQTE